MHLSRGVIWVLTLPNPSDFKSEILLICFATSNRKHFSVGLKIRLDSLDNQLPFSCHETRKQPLLSAPKKAPEEDEEEFDEATVSQAAAKVICSCFSSASFLRTWWHYHV